MGGRQWVREAAAGLGGGRRPGPGPDARTHRPRTCRAREPEHRPSFVHIVDRLKAIVELESPTRSSEAHPAPQPGSPAPIKTFRLQDSGPAVKEATAVLQRRRIAMQGRTPDSGASSGAGTGTSSVAQPLSPTPEEAEAFRS